MKVLPFFLGPASSLAEIQFQINFDILWLFPWISATGPDLPSFGIMAFGPHVGKLGNRYPITKTYWEQHADQQQWIGCATDDEEEKKRARLQHGLG